MGPAMSLTERFSPTWGALVGLDLLVYTHQHAASRRRRSAPRAHDAARTMDDGTIAGRKAVMGALRLYLDFINQFRMLLRLFADRR